MAFLNKTKMKKMAQVASVLPHPLLSETTLDSAVRTAYVEGCVLAALIDDAKVSDAENSIILEIGLSLQMPEGDIAESLEHVKALPDDDEKQAFVEEICGMLEQEPVRKHFIGDFEKVLKANGKISAEAQELFEYICTRLFRSSSWSQGKGADDSPKQIIAEGKKDGERKQPVDHRRPVNVVLTKPCGPFSDFLNYVAGFFDCDIEEARYVWYDGHGILFKNISRRDAEEVVQKLAQLGCRAEIQVRHEATARDSTEDPAGTAFSVWLVRKPEKSHEMIKGMVDSVLHACGGTGKLSELLYRYGTGVLCSNVSLNMAKAVRSCVERFGGVVEIKPS